MGTTYNVTYFDKNGRNFKPALDSLLLVVNKSINNYDSTSEVSSFNKPGNGIKPTGPYFLPPLYVAKKVFEESNGAFDMTLMPIVNAWGFGPKKSERVDSAHIAKLLVHTGFEKIAFSANEVTKSDTLIQLDFGGIGQGYGADVMAEFLRSKGITNFLVELGGEGVVAGINLQSRKPWEIGILDPASTRDSLIYKAIASLKDRAFTTSGNYFNYKIIDGKKYSHTINPETGFPVQHNLLSATVFTKECILADAWGTAFMVMGLEKAKEIASKNQELEVLLFYSDENGITRYWMSPGLTSIIKIL